MAKSFFVETCEGHKFWFSKSAVSVIGTKVDDNKAIAVGVMSGEEGVILNFKDAEDRNEKLEEMIIWFDE